jgi:CDP-paratose 2-epimerase
VAHGFEVRGMDKKLGSSTADFAGLERVVAEFVPDLIVHLGANCSSQISLRDPMTDFSDNVVGTFNVCEVARLHGRIPIIFNSSMKIYPGEDGIVAPYGQSKQVGEYYLRMYATLYGVPFIINRPSSVCGPRQDGSEDGGWFTWFIRASLTNQPVVLFGDGTQSRDVLYIDDHIDLLFEQVNDFQRFANDDFDFGGGLANELSLNELLDALNYHNTTNAPKLLGDMHRFVCDNVKIGTVSAWRPKIGWQEGMRRTLDHFR